MSSRFYNCSKCLTLTDHSLDDKTESLIEDFIHSETGLGYKIFKVVSKFSCTRCRKSKTVRSKKSDYSNDKQTGWIITHDHIKDENDKVGDAGTYGPGETTLTPEEIEKFGRVFKIYDDDGELYYTGKIIGGDGFEPLEDFGTPNAGATEIRYNGKRL